VKSLVALAATAALAGCALKSDVRRVESELVALRRATARADSARAVALERVLDEIAETQRLFTDSLAVQQRRLAVFQGQVRGDLTEVQRQLVQIQELTGQSQQRLSELRAQLETRTRQVPAPQPGAPVDSAAAATGPGPEELYDLAVRQLRGGSLQTARMAFTKFLQDFPQHDRVPDAWFQVGETWAGTNGDSAAAAYDRVAKDHPDSPRAPAALYKLGLLAEQRGDMPAARVYYNRVVAGYPRSEEAQLARTKLQARDR
jgi:tol-pal system protein YbgF